MTQIRFVRLFVLGSKYAAICCHLLQQVDVIVFLGYVSSTRSLEKIMVAE